MKYNDKLRLFIKSKGISQKEIAQALGHSPAMIGRFLNGTSEFGPTFIVDLLRLYPEIDLKYIFSEDAINHEVNDTIETYQKEVDVISELQIIENTLSELRSYLAQKCHKE